MCRGCHCYMIVFNTHTLGGCMCIRHRRYENNCVHRIPLGGVNSVHFMRIKVPLGGCVIGILDTDS